jgi:uncharacterized BrkB/YihY/UPF0761 family membrane protein
VLSGLVTTAGATTGLGAFSRGLATIVATAINIGLFLIAYHLLSARRTRLRDRWVAAVAAGVTWQVLLSIGTFLVGTRLAGASATYGFFGIVLGLLGWLYLAASVFVLCAELDAVLTRRLHPRSLMSMYPDDRDTTVADRRAYASYAESERQKDFQSVDVNFSEEEPQEPSPGPVA